MSREYRIEIPLVGSDQWLTLATVRDPAHAAELVRVLLTHGDQAQLRVIVVPGQPPPF